MSMYNAIFGENGLAEVLLRVIGETRETVGRFRDAYIVSDVEIAVYTRNGGNNRECACADDPEYGTARCKHHVVPKEVDETLYVEEGEVANYPSAYNVWCGGKRMVGTGRRIMKDYYHCEAPASDECGCYGCAISYRLPKNPLYLRDEDDDFDDTYATIYFSVPEAARPLIGELREGRTDTPAEKWEKLFADLEGGKVAPEAANAIEACRGMLKAVTDVTG